jgi:hypothetical protein
MGGIRGVHHPAPLVELEERPAAQVEELQVAVALVHGPSIAAEVEVRSGREVRAVDAVRGDTRVVTEEGAVDDQLSAARTGDDGVPPGERLHSRRTILSGAAMGVGLAVAAVGAAAGAAPADAASTPDAASTQGRVVTSGAVATARTPHPRDVDGSADFTVSGTSSFSDVVHFARSGVVSIGAGRHSATHTGVALASTSLVLANLQGHVPGLYVAAVVPNVAGSAFEIFLNEKVPAGKTAKVAWFVVN